LFFFYKDWATVRTSYPCDFAREGRIK